METRLLQYFLAVAQEQNFSRAAELLHTSQPNLSKQLSDLESQLGKQLFIRGSRHITLTEEGYLLQKRAQQILSLIQQTETDVQTLNQSLSGTIRLGAEDASLFTLLSPLMQQMHRDHPQVTFELNSGTSRDLSDMLQQGSLDFAILSESAPGMEQLHTHPLSKADPIGLLMAEHHPLTSSKTISASQISTGSKGTPFLLTRQQLADPNLSHWLGTPLSTLNTLAVIEQLHSSVPMIAFGMGIAFCPASFAEQNAHTPPLIWRPLTPPLTTSRSFSWNPHHTHSKAAAHFLTLVQSRTTSTPMS